MKNTTSTKNNTTNTKNCKTKSCTNSKSSKGSKNCSNTMTEDSCEDCPRGCNTDPLGSYTGNPTGFGKYSRPVQDADDL